MEISPLNLATTNPTTAANAQALRLVAGDVTQIQTGVTVAASVLRVGNGEATLNIGGNQLTVRSPISVNVGDILSLRVTSGGTPTLELIGRTTNAPVVPTVPIAMVEKSQDIATTVASEILRRDRPPLLGETAPKLLRELATLPPETPGVTQTREVLEAMLPKPGSPTKVEQVKAVVERGGEQLEANLAKRALGERVSLNTDLKSGLLRLVQSLPNIAEALPSARPTLDGIETRQASQLLAQEHGGPIVFQIPYLDGTNWRTAQLALEPDRTSPDDPPDTPPGFRIMMHTPLDNLGDVWLDAHLVGEKLQAILYLAGSDAREQIRGSLVELRAELQTAGYSQVQLDVRSATELSERQRKRLNVVMTGLPESVSILDVRV